MTATDRRSSFSQLLAELRRRRVVRFAFGYAAAAFVALQLAEIVFPAFGIGEGALRLLVVVCGLGFLPALVLAWVYDITKDGIRRTEDGGTGEMPSRLALSSLLVVTVVVTGGLGLYLASHGVLSTVDGTAADPAGATADGAVTPAAYDPSQPIRSVAVLPLDDFSPSRDQEYFTAAMHEELIAKLSMLSDVRVVSRTTVMRYGDPQSRPASPELGRLLGVDALIEGSVTRSDTQVRITLQIIHARSDSHVETLQWERPRDGDVLALQTEVAHAVVDVIDRGHDHTEVVEVASADVEPAAQESYLRARMEYDRGTPEGLRSALAYFQDALDKDPDFAAAMAGAAGARLLVDLEDSVELGEAVGRARADAAMAYRMDSTSVEAREVLSIIERSVPRVAGAAPAAPAPPTVESRVVTVAGPGDAITVDMAALDTSWVGAVTGLGARIEERMREAGMHSSEAFGARHAFEASVMMRRGRYAEAIGMLEGVVDTSPELTSAWDLLARSHAASGDAVGAVEVVGAWHDSGAGDPPDDTWLRRLEEAVEADGTRGYWQWRLDRLEMHVAAGRVIPSSELAAAHAALGENDRALEYLREALEEGDPGILTLRSDPVWDDLRGDRDFRQITRQAQALRFSPTLRGPGAPGRDR